MALIPAPRRLRLEVCKFEASLGYVARCIFPPRGSG
jgi:hypothetical protein